MFERDLYLCQICARENRLTWVDLHGPDAGICDHIVPLSQGGTDDEDNLQTICRPCDKRKTRQEAARGGR